MSNEGTTQHFIFLQIVNCVVPSLDMAYPSPSCLCSRPTLHFPSVYHGNCVVPSLDMVYPSPSCRKCKGGRLQRQLGEG
jgi:hypothetical protein